MPKFREIEALHHPPPHLHPPPPPPPLLANRYVIHKRLGRGSFGTVYLIEDTRTSRDKLKVLKEIPVGDLKPDETVKATQEAQLLSQLHHPAILRFYTSFLERDSFCIVTEFCEDGDLECTLERLRVSGEALCESQIREWLVQMLLGVDYMHERRILHRDLKTKNVFLKQKVVKIGDFGVSCLLMGSCDLATTFTGTPYYMSPEALGHHGYDSKSDVWSLGCILYEMCCLKHAFEGQSFLSVVQKIMESPTPSLPEKYSPELNSLMQKMLERSPSLRVSAAEALSTDVIKELTQHLKQRLSEDTAVDDRGVSHIASVLQKKVHLQTLRERSEVEKMSPRERMRLRKQQAADERARKLKHIVEEKYKENQQRMMELRCKNFQRLSINVLTDKAEDTVRQIQPIRQQKVSLSSRPGPMGEQLTDHDIPEDPQAAEVYYSEDGFESCSDEDDFCSDAPSQDSDLEAVLRHMEDVLQEKSIAGEEYRGVSHSGLHTAINSNMDSIQNTRGDLSKNSLISHPDHLTIRTSDHLNI
ncbi:serine/threonine-protein kinase Nek11 isoform X3 [Tachysurus fulvidraco]|uniref:serine/threonine-protein kinase Nek11 isoform X3 n=1 Tax=Tachysurus fulvidraco TaxID=1234273 RepID=UPI001FEF66AA|nr:serine/threonine-protein kinase Nek11 isoform X3 [Tachysurus fulvidraco]